MTPYSDGTPSHVDPDALTETIERALRSAGLDTGSGPMRDVTETIRQALRSATRGGGSNAAPQPRPPDTQGEWQHHRFQHATGGRDYRLYVPPGLAPGAPVVAMLHGCTQAPEDFAAGTRMNRLADQHGFLVVYPEQPPQANPSKCWNWFRPEDQQRERGEPAVLAGLLQQVLAREGADPRRVFVAGLSAGGAMAVVLGETWPDLVAAVGVHSGLPYGAAHDVGSALAAMKGERRRTPGAPGAPAPVLPRRRATQARPTIVFHGDRDHTVQWINGARIADQALEAHNRGAAAPLRETTTLGASADGRRYTRVVHADAEGRARVEAWTLHGAGHAWSGGSSAGSFTDARGPDASAEMWRFFSAVAGEG